jgi:hypothetical protein
MSNENETNETRQDNHLNSEAELQNLDKEKSFTEKISDVGGNIQNSFQNVGAGIQNVGQNIGSGISSGLASTTEKTKSIFDSIRQAGAAGFGKVGELGGMIKEKVAPNQGDAGTSAPTDSNAEFGSNQEPPK